MTDGTDALVAAFRDYVTEGLPISGPNDPDKAEVRAAIGQIASELGAAMSGLTWKTPVVAASTANVAVATALINGSTMDGVTLATGDRVLLKNQTTAAENGVYVVVASGAASRATDMNTGGGIVSAVFYVKGGTANGFKLFATMTPAPIVPGTTSLSFAIVADFNTMFSSVIQPLVTAAAASATAAANSATTAAGVAGTYTVQSVGGGLAIIDPNGNAAGFINQTIFRHAVIDAVTQLISLMAGPQGFAIGDLLGNAWIAANPDTINHKQINALQIASDAGLAARTVVGQIDGPPGVALVDPSGNAVAVFRGDRAITANTASSAREIKRGHLFDKFEELTAIFGMGQSLLLGYGAACQPSITTAALSYAFKFVGGVRIQDLSTTVSTDLASIVPFAEADASTSAGAAGSYGETPMGGIAWAIYQLLYQEDGIDLSVERSRLLLGTPGASGTSANSLLTGAAMSNFNAMIAAAKANGEASGYIFKGCAAMPYVQGEQDYFQNTDPTTWKGYIRAMRDSAAAQNLTTLGSPRVPIVFPYQIASHLYYGRTTPSLALALLELEQEAYFGRCVPTHNLARSGGDNLHLTVASSHELGLRIGTQIKRRLIDKKDGAGIRAGTATKSGGVVTIPVSWLTGSTPGASLVVDTAVGTVSNYGFALYDAGGSAVTITAVTVNSNNIALSYSTGMPTEWRYGWTGFNAYWGFGQIRDNDPLAIQGSNGNVFKLYNWLPISKGTIA